MLTLSSALLAAQKSLNKTPLWKVVLSRSGQTTRGYDSSRIRKISETETPSGDTVEIILNNTDGALTSLDFEHYQVVISFGFHTAASRSAWATNTAYAIDDIRVPVTANGYQYRCSVAGTSHATTEPTWTTSLGVQNTDGTVTWEMDGNSGNEYARLAPLRVRTQELHSSQGILRVILRPAGIFNQLGKDKAESVHTQKKGDTRTIKTLFTAIAGATLAPYTNYTAYTVVYDSEDSIIDSFTPEEFFSVQLNETREAKLDELLSYTGCKRRAENDGKIHVFDPVTTGATYAYEYKLNVSGEHQFWNKAITLKFIEPNIVTVKTPDTDISPHSGNATSATSYAEAYKGHTIQKRLASDAQAAAIAAAIIESNELDAEKGLAIVPMNVGQQLWDYVKFTDARENDTRVGNVQFIQREVEIHLGNQALTWRMIVGFGKTSALSIMASLVMAASAGAGETETIISVDVPKPQALLEAIVAGIEYNAANIAILFAAHNALREYVLSQQSDEATFRKLTVTDELIIPSEAA